MDHFIRNGELLPIDEATVDLRNIQYTYGFGVYESIRVSKGVVYFAHEHIERLMHSARTIGLEHPFSEAEIAEWTQKLVDSCGSDRFNLKMLLIGGKTLEEAMFVTLPLNPLFPEKRSYTQGVKVISVQYERYLPQAKTLNMLGSYLSYRQAREAGAEDALLVNKAGCITEGTKSNVLAVRDRTLISPPFEEILDGVTRRIVVDLAQKNGFELTEEPIVLDQIDSYDGLMLTSSSMKVVPIAQVDDQELQIPETTRELMKLYDKFLNSCDGKFGND